MNTQMNNIEMAKGQDYSKVAEILAANGYRKIGWHTDRNTKNCIAKWVKGHNETQEICLVTHDWIADHYGISKPGKVVNAEMYNDAERD